MRLAVFRIAFMKVKNLHKRDTKNILENESFNSICANIKYDKTAWRQHNLKWTYIIGDTDKIIKQHI